MPTVVATLTHNRFAEIAARLPREAREVAAETAHEIEADAKQRMAEPKSGRMYGAHRASAPGEAPAMDTGALASSIQVAPERGSTYVVFTNQEYAAHLEFGTVKMAPRPFFGPAASRALPGFVDAIGDLERRLA